MVSPADIAREYVENWNRRDWKAYRELLDDQYTYTGGDGQTQRGPEAGMAVGQMFATAFPDGRIDLRQIHTAGDTAIVEFTGRGTHSGDLMGIAPTGRHISIPVITVLTVRGGRIVSEREYMDMAHMMRQLGVMPAAATA
ncbi:MAG: ester cyclase [Chloroflexi bacterium]|nr:MAG: ester cyclase [Chloroflexota bacterium]